MAIYQDSAAYREDNFQNAQATLVLKGYRSVDGDDKIETGYGAVIHTETDGAAELLTKQPTDSLKTSIDANINLALMMGARLITDAAANETAEAARIKHGAETSELLNIANNIDDAMEKIIGWMLQFERVQGDFSFETNKSFFETSMTQERVNAVISLVQSVLPYTKRDAFEWAQKNGWVSPWRDYDEAMEEKDEELNNSIMMSFGAQDDRPDTTT
jgi:hypothetical protein